MSTEVKLKSSWEPEAQDQKPFSHSSTSLESEFTSYNFLRNIWGTHFHNRDSCFAEDKIDQINKIVAMMKAQIKFMTMHQKTAANLNTLQNNAQQQMTICQLQHELELTKQRLEGSRMREEQFYVLVHQRNQKIRRLEEDNERLKMEMFQVKEGKNRMSEQVIKLSSKIYQLERTNLRDISLDRLSAISIDREEEPSFDEKMIICSKKESVFDLCEETKSGHDSEENEQEILNELHLNIPERSKKGMKKSLQCYYDQQINQDNYRDFVKEMKQLRQKTQRFMNKENDLSMHRSSFCRKPVEPSTERPLRSQLAEAQRDRRFKRIR